MCRRPPPSDRFVFLPARRSRRRRAAVAGGGAGRAAPWLGVLICSALCWRANNATGGRAVPARGDEDSPRTPADTLQLRPGVRIGLRRRDALGAFEGADEESAQRRRLVRGAEACCRKAPRHAKRRSPASPRAGDRPHYRALANRPCGDFSELLLNLEACCASTRPSPPRTSAGRGSHNLRQYGLALGSVETATSAPTSPRRGKRAPTFVASWVVSTQHIDSIGKAISLDPANKEWRDALVDLRLSGEWSNYQSDFAELREEIWRRRRRFAGALPRVPMFSRRTIRRRPDARQATPARLAQ